MEDFNKVAYPVSRIFPGTSAWKKFPPERFSMVGSLIRLQCSCGRIIALELSSSLAICPVCRRLMHITYDFKELIVASYIPAFLHPDCCMKCEWWSQTLPTSEFGNCGLGYWSAPFHHPANFFPPITKPTNTSLLSDTRYSCWCNQINPVIGSGYKGWEPLSGHCIECGEQSWKLKQSRKYISTIDTDILVGLCSLCQYPCKLLPLDEGVIELVRKIYDR